MDAAEAHEATPNQDGDPNMTPEIPTAAAVDGETEINDDGEDPKDSLSRLQKGVGWRSYQKKHSGGPAAATRFGWRGGGALPRQPQQQQQHEEEEKDHHQQQQEEEENTNGALRWALFMSFCFVYSTSTTYFFENIFVRLLYAQQYIQHLASVEQEAWCRPRSISYTRAGIHTYHSSVVPWCRNGNPAKTFKTSHTLATDRSACAGGRCAVLCAW